MDSQTALLLAKGAKSSAAAALVKDILKSPSIYSFSLFLNLPSITHLNGSPHQSHWNTLLLFAYGSLKDYSPTTHLPDLINDCPDAWKKLRILTLLSTCRAMRGRLVPYSVLMRDLLLASVREVEDVVIAAIELDLLVAKLDQKRACLVVTSCKSRDIQSSDIPHLITAISNWHETASTLLNHIHDASANVENQVAASEIQEREWSEHVKDLSAKILATEGGNNSMNSMMGMGMGMGMGKKGKRPLGGDHMMGMPYPGAGHGGSGGGGGPSSRRMR